MSQLKTRIINRNDTEQNWKTQSSQLVGAYIPKCGEFLIYNVDENHHTARVKVGDGKTSVNDLPYIRAGYADMLAGACSIKVTGAINGQLSFDGSKDITIKAVLDKLGAHTHDVAVAGTATISYTRPTAVTTNYTPEGTITAVSSVGVTNTSASKIEAFYPGSYTPPTFYVNYGSEDGQLEVDINSAYTPPSLEYDTVACIGSITATPAEIALQGKQATLSSTFTEEPVQTTANINLLGKTSANTDIDEFAIKFEVEDSSPKASLASESANS